MNAQDALAAALHDIFMEHGMGCAHPGKPLSITTADCVAVAAALTASGWTLAPVQTEGPWALDVHRPITSLSIAIDPPEYPGGALVFWHDEDGGHSFAITLPSRCAWCNAAFDEDGIEAIRAHVFVCENHPLRAAPPAPDLRSAVVGPPITGAALVERIREDRLTSTPAPDPLREAEERIAALTDTLRILMEERDTDRAALAAIAQPAPDPLREAALALLNWYDTTHGNEFGHDHHCPVPWDDNPHTQTPDDRCTCGWSAFLRADDKRAALAAPDPLRAANAVSQGNAIDAPDPLGPDDHGHTGRIWCDPCVGHGVMLEQATHRCAQPAPDPLREAALAVVEVHDGPHHSTYDHLIALLPPIAALRAALALDKELGQ